MSACPSPFCSQLRYQKPSAESSYGLRWQRSRNRGLVASPSDAKRATLQKALPMAPAALLGMAREQTADH